MKIQKLLENNRECLLRLCLLFVCVLLLGVTGCNEPVVAPTYDEEIEPEQKEKLFGIVSHLDEVNGEISIYTLGREVEYELSFTAGADVRNQYGDLILMSDVKLGSVVDVTYDANRDKLLSIYLTDEEAVSRVDDVSGAIFDYAEYKVRINGTTYQMSDDVRVFSDNVEIALNEICSEDQLTMWMYRDQICSIYVELGHGYLRLHDYAGYIGGMVEVGYDVIVPVTEEMLLTVREGSYELRITKDDYVGTKRVDVIKNQEIDVSLADIAIEPKQIGSVMFDISPANAKVYIDRQRVNTEGAIDLTYGKHVIHIMAEGYESYSATFTVNAAYKIREYELKKSDEKDDKKADSTAKAESSTKKDKTTESTTSNGTTEAGQKEETTTETSTQDKDSDVKDVSTAIGEKTKNKVILTAPIGASVYFDGEYLGIAPISFTKVTGSHIITFSQSGCLSKSYTVDFKDDGKDVTLSYDNLVLISSLIE